MRVKDMGWEPTSGGITPRQLSRQVDPANATKDFDKYVGTDKMTWGLGGRILGARISEVWACDVDKVDASRRNRDEWYG